MNQNLKKITVTAMMSALAFALFFLEFPLFAAHKDLKFDFSDIPALVAGVLFGPLYAVLVELIKNLLDFAVKGFATQLGFGNIMNFLVGCAFCVPFSFFFRTFKNSQKQIFKALLPPAAGLIIMVLTGLAGNYFIAPPFFKFYHGMVFTAPVLWGFIAYATALNAVKAVMLGVVSRLIPMEKLHRGLFG